MQNKERKGQWHIGALAVKAGTWLLQIIAFITVVYAELLALMTGIIPVIMQMGVLNSQYITGQEIAQLRIVDLFSFFMIPGFFGCLLIVALLVWGDINFWRWMSKTLCRFRKPLYTKNKKD